MLAARGLSLCGIAVILVVAWGLSRNRKAIPWRVVAIGMGLQWLVALCLLKLEWGQYVLGKLAAGVSTVLEQSFAGSGFLFGELGQHMGGSSGFGVVFAFQVLPTIIFIAALFSVLYYLGVMQRIVGLMAKAAVRLFGASGAESLAVAASVFMGQTESPLTIRPFLAKLTESELFVVMVSDMASVSGAILGAYVLIGGVEIEHLLMAVAMT
ncbi:MAG: Na+ dependent nucleoside transporter N-terminal domain-containing protein, partial [Nannocystaceae bacterium]